MDADVVTLTEYAAPEGFGAFVFSAVLFYFVCRASLPWVVPGSAAWDLVSAVFPGGPVWYHWVVKFIFWPTVLLHTGEAVVFDRVRLQRHGVPRGSKLWWLWTSNCWVEGVTTFKRIDRLVAAKRAQGSKKK